MTRKQQIVQHPRSSAAKTSLVFLAWMIGLELLTISMFMLQGQPFLAFKMIGPILHGDRQGIRCHIDPSSTHTHFGKPRMV